MSADHEKRLRITGEFEARGAQKEAIKAGGSDKPQDVHVKEGRILGHMAASQDGPTTTPFPGLFGIFPEQK